MFEFARTTPIEAIPRAWELEETAWILVQPKDGGPIGFKTPAQRQDDEDDDMAAKS